MNLIERVTFLNCIRFVGKWASILYMGVVCYVTLSILESSFNFADWSGITRGIFAFCSFGVVVTIKEVVSERTNNLNDFHLNKENIKLLFKCLKESLYVLFLGIFYTLLVLLNFYILFAFILLEINILINPIATSIMFFIGSMGMLLSVVCYFSEVNSLRIANKERFIKR